MGSKGTINETIGCLVINNELIAEVRLKVVTEEGVMKNYENTYIKLLFDKSYKKHELKEKYGLNMPLYFSKFGKHWSCKVSSTEHFYSLLNSLKKLGFTIDDINNNPGLQKFLASKI